MGAMLKAATRRAGEIVGDPLLTPRGGLFLTASSDFARLHRAPRNGACTDSAPSRPSASGIRNAFLRKLRKLGNGTGDSPPRKCAGKATL